LEQENGVGGGCLVGGALWGVLTDSDIPRFYSETTENFPSAIILLSNNPEMMEKCDEIRSI